MLHLRHKRKYLSWFPRRGHQGTVRASSISLAFWNSSKSAEAVISPVTKTPTDKSQFWEENWSHIHTINVIHGINLVDSIRERSNRFASIKTQISLAAFFAQVKFPKLNELTFCEIAFSTYLRYARRWQLPRWEFLFSRLEFQSFQQIHLAAIGSRA